MDSHRRPEDLHNHFTKEPILDANGKYQGVFAVITDITRLKAIEKDLRRREKELEIETSNLEEANTALKVLLKRIDEDKKELEEKVISNMRELVGPCLEKLKRSEVKELVNTKMKEFKSLGKKSSDKIFNELCFCILTANFNAERCIKIQSAVGEGFCYLIEPKLIERLKQLGHRFPETRGKYIAEAQQHKDTLKRKINEFENERELREWLVENVKGIGYKEASHFLRNIGFTNSALIDFHIIDILVRHKLIERPKTLTRKKYLEIEDVLKTLAQKTNLNLAELDLYLWYLETGKVLK